MAQVFFCEFFEIFKIKFFYRIPPGGRPWVHARPFWLKKHFWLYVVWSNVDNKAGEEKPLSFQLNW